jgi:hypothetical protein
MEVSGQIHDPTALPPPPPGKNLLPIEYETGWAPEPVWTILEKRKLLALAGIRTMGHPARS